MENTQRDPSEMPAVLHDVLGEIEGLRLRRQAEIKERPHPQLKRFTQQELNDVACPTYKNLLVGRSRRIPSRETILQIAQYLECTAAERNDLLLAARCLPETLELEGSKLAQVVEQAQRLMETLPYPALVVTHTLEVRAVNEPFQRLYDFPSLTAFPKAQQHLFYFLFHPGLPVRVRSTFNQQATKIWQSQASRGIQLFRHSNVLYQFEPWYQDLVERYNVLADFREYWEQDAQPVEYLSDSPSKMLLSRNARTGELLPILLRHIHISVSWYMYPGIVAFLPVDEAAREVYASLGYAQTQLSNLR